MRDEDHGAFEILQRVDQHLLGRQVEVVGRLVEHQEVRRVVEHPRHGEPRLLAAGERADLLVHVVAGELKRAGEVTQRAETVLRKILSAAVR